MHIGKFPRGLFADDLSISFTIRSDASCGKHRMSATGRLLRAFFGKHETNKRFHRLSRLGEDISFFPGSSRYAPMKHVWHPSFLACLEFSMNMTKILALLHNFYKFTYLSLHSLKIFIKKRRCVKNRVCTKLAGHSINSALLWIPINT